MDKNLDDQISVLYRQMHDFLYFKALSSLQNHGLAEEAVQETFMIACQKPEQLLTSKNPQGWLVETLKNVIRNQARAKARLSRYILENDENRALVFGEESSTFDDYTSIEYSDIVSPIDFKMLRMYVFDRCSMLEISQKFGLSLDATRKRIQRARAKLKANEEKIRKI